MIHTIDKTLCCACGACKEKCSLDAISMTADKFGNYYPVVDSEKCVHCGQCKTVCPVGCFEPRSHLQRVYAVKLKNTSRLKKSASGGAFFALAQTFIEQMKGNVYGCSYDAALRPVHSLVTETEQLYRLQGSKYVRSHVEVYGEILDQLKKGEYVLFCGTPCQCQAVKCFSQGYLEHLVTVEVICHGVIDQDYWMDYIRNLSNQHCADIIDYSFRTKEKHGDFVASYVTRSIGKTGQKTEKIFYETPATSYYYSHFLQGKIFRENCYSCPFAAKARAADITIGDYWGYHGRLDAAGGLSVVMTNNEKGQMLFDLACELVDFEERSFADAAEKNEQLTRPFDKSKMDYSILEEWKARGVSGLERQHHKRHWKASLMRKLGVLK